MKRCPTPRFLAVVAATLCLSLFAVSGYAQLQTGNIYGKVQAKDGSVLPGVTVTLTGIGAPQTQVSDAQGNFRYLNLSPGTYTLKAELAGYGTSTRAGVGVRVGSNADVTMTLNPSVSESITVTAEAPLLDVRKAGSGINVTKVEMEKIPTSRDPWTVLQQAPAVQVDRMNVGGNQSGQQSVYNANGATSDQNTWNMDGVNITDMGATGSSPLYFDFDSFEEMQITTGGSDPRVMTPGVQLNMVTKRGTNDWRGSGRYFYTPGSYQSTPTVPPEAQSYLVQANAINFVRDFGGEVGGPIWRDHAWFWIADAENKISNQNALTVGAVPAFDNIILRDKNAKLNGQITASNSGVGFYTFGDKVRNARNLSPTRPFETAWHQSGPTKVYKAEDTQIFGSSLYLTGMWSKVTGGFSLIPNGGIGPTAPTSYRDLTNVWHNTRLFYITERPQKQYRADGSKFFDLGSMNHELKFGFGYRSTPIGSQSGYPGPVQGYFRDRPESYCATRNVVGTGTCYTAFLTRFRDARFDEKYNDAYAGDTILMGNLTLQVGARYDIQKTKNTASSVGANPILGTPLTLPVTGLGINTISLPGLNFGGDSRQMKWTSVTPRVGLTYSLGADKKTLLRAAYNRYVNQIGSAINAINPIGYYSYWIVAGRDANGDKVPQRSELQRVVGFGYLDPANPGALSSTIRADYGMKPPHSDEFTGGIEREVLTDFSIGVNATYRKYSDLTFLRAEHTQGKGDWFTPADYVVGGTTDPKLSTGTGGTLTVPTRTYYVLKNPNDIPTFFVFTNRPDYNRTYAGIDLTATKRLSHRWMLRGNVSYNDWKEHCGAGSIQDPTPQITNTTINCAGGVFAERSAGSGAFGNVFIQTKWSYNVTGLYQLPWDFSLGASLTGRQGYPDPISEAITGSDEVTRNVVVAPIGSFRFPNVYELDLRAAKDFRFMNRVGVTLSADLFNVPNQRTILQRQAFAGDVNNDPGNFNNISEIQSPRVWRFGARFTF